jgi:endoglucanase
MDIKSCRASAAEQSSAFACNRRLGRGVNILGYDPLWSGRSQARFQEKHFRLLKQAGFDHVRVNLHAFRHMRNDGDLALSLAWFATLDWVVEQALAAGLLVILDCHEFTALGDDPGANQAKFLSFWRQLAEHTRCASDRVVFELLNEPSRNLTPELWNEYLAAALGVVRAVHPERPVIVGPACWNSIGHLAELRLPEEDRNLIVTVHYYSPMEFTHQGAPWSSHRDLSGVDWTGSEVERRKVRDDLGVAQAWAEAAGRPLFLGEFGAYDQAPLAARLRYTDCVARTAEEFGWSWAYWQFDSDFLLWDMAADDWVKPIRDALIPPACLPA